MPEPIAYDQTTAASIVGVSDRTLRDAIAEGSLVAHYVGRKPLISRADLIAWFEALPTERRAS